MTADIMANKQVLRECLVFSAVTDAELEKIASLVEEKEYGAGTAIFEEGDSAEELIVLQEGKVALQTLLSATQGQVQRRVTVDAVGKNEVIGWSSLVEPYVYTLTAVCLQKAQVLSINGAKLRWLFQDNYHVGYEVLNGLIKVVASRLSDTRQVLASERWLPLEPK